MPKVGSYSKRFAKIYAANKRRKGFTATIQEGYKNGRKLYTVYFYR